MTHLIMEILLKFSKKSSLQVRSPGMSLTLNTQFVRFPNPLHMDTSVMGSPLPIDFIFFSPQQYSCPSGLQKGTFVPCARVNLCGPVGLLIPAPAVFLVQVPMDPGRQIKAGKRAKRFLMLQLLSPSPPQSTLICTPSIPFPALFYQSSATPLAYYLQQTLPVQLRCHHSHKMTWWHTYASPVLVRMGP